MVLSRGVVCSVNEASEDPPSRITNVRGVLLSTSMISVYALPGTAVNVVNLTVITVRIGSLCFEAMLEQNTIE